MKLTQKLTASLALLAVSVPVFAHSGHGVDNAHGLLHSEHILSLLAIGVLVAVAFASNRR
jgi:hydrogenase/urease accessory protein HupE